MNAIDLIVVLTLIVAVWGGWKQGFIVQICSLAGIVAGLWLAWEYGGWLGEALKLDSSYAKAVGFVIILLSMVIVVAIFAKIIRMLCNFVGFGIADSLLGVVISVAKYALVLGALLGAFETMNKDYSLLDAQKIEQSKFNKPLIKFSGALLPFLTWVGDQAHKIELPKVK